MDRFKALVAHDRATVSRVGGLGVGEGYRGQFNVLAGKVEY
jgi:hypothetical protein